MGPSSHPHAAAAAHWIYTPLAPSCRICCRGAPPRRIYHRELLLTRSTARELLLAESAGLEQHLHLLLPDLVASRRGPSHRARPTAARAPTTRCEPPLAPCTPPPPPRVGTAPRAAATTTGGPAVAPPREREREGERGREMCGHRWESGIEEAE